MLMSWSTSFRYVVYVQYSISLHHLFIKSSPWACSGWRAGLNCSNSLDAQSAQWTLTTAAALSHCAMPEVDLLDGYEVPHGLRRGLGVACLLLLLSNTHTLPQAEVLNCGSPIIHIVQIIISSTSLVKSFFHQGYTTDFINLHRLIGCHICNFLIVSVWIIQIPTFRLFVCVHLFVHINCSELKLLLLFAK